jgi:hypothetical protein
MKYPITRLISSLSKIAKLQSARVLTLSFRMTSEFLRELSATVFLPNFTFPLPIPIFAALKKSYYEGYTYG